MRFAPMFFGEDDRQNAAPFVQYKKEPMPSRIGRSKNESRIMLRKFFFWLHLSVGLVVGLLIAAMALTGLGLAFERQIMRGIGMPKSDASAHALRVPVDAVLAGLPQQGVPTQLIEHRDMRSMLEIRYGHERTVLADPRTGEIVGEPSQGWMRFFALNERIHRRLGLSMQNAFGHAVTGAVTLGFFCILLSGLVLWFPRRLSGANWRVRLLLYRGQKGRARHWNQHNAIGIWLLLPLLAITSTGVIMAYPWATNLLYRVTGSAPPAEGGRHGEAPRGGARGDKNFVATAAQNRFFEPMVALAAERVPDWQTITLTIPGAGDKTVAVAADPSRGGMPEKVTQLVFDRSNGHLVRVTRFGDQPMGRRLRMWARFVHTGEEFGLLGQCVAAVAALGALWLVWTGWALSWRRFFGTRPKPVVQA